MNRIWINGVELTSDELGAQASDAKLDSAGLYFALRSSEPSPEILRLAQKYQLSFTLTMSGAASEGAAEAALMGAIREVPLVGYCYLRAVDGTYYRLESVRVTQSQWTHTGLAWTKYFTITGRDLRKQAPPGGDTDTGEDRFTTPDAFWPAITSPAWASWTAHNWPDS